jgi:predicted enzyme related to lactoylglutathione lyase
MRDLLVNIDVDDLARATRFYTQALGLAVGRRLGPAAVELVGGPVKIYLLEKAPGSKSSVGGEARDYRRHWTPVHLDVVVDELEAGVARVLAAGATPEGERVEATWGRMQVFADPFGHGICVLEFNARGYEALVEG